MAEVAFHQVSRRFGGDVMALRDLSIDIADGEFLILVGPSGCGKSTALRILAGLDKPTSGEIRVGGKAVTNLGPGERDIAMVFQNYALYPHMSVAENMGFSLKIAGVNKDERATRVAEAAKLLDLTDYLERKPKALSGGQRQRVAMGRAIVRNPQVFCMDEPLSNLDAKLRVQTRTQIAALQRRLGVTTVYVTHDQVEAMTMGDRVAVMKDGLLQQCATPREMYDRPTNVFVAGFIGSPAMNIAQFDIDEHGAHVGSTHLRLPRATLDAIGTAKRVTLGFRPESLEPAGEGEGFPVMVDVIEELGSDAYVYGTLADGATVTTVDPNAGPDQDPSVGDTRGTFIARVDPRNTPSRGDKMWLTVREGEIHAFSAETGERLPS